MLVPECTTASFLDAKLVAMRAPESTGAEAPALDSSPIMSPVVPAVNRPSSPLLQDGGEGDDELGDDDDSLSRDDDDDDDDEGDEEEEEPRLKYQRLGGSVPSLLSSDAASCLTIAERIIVLGTHDGSVHLLDFQGNQVLSSVSLFLPTPSPSLSLSPFSHAHTLPHATIVTFECLKSGSQMRVAHNRNRHLMVLLWKWDTASRLSFRRIEHLLNSEKICLRGTNEYLCLKNQQKPFCFGVCFQSYVEMFLGLF
jgi:hypothetical protein